MFQKTKLGFQFKILSVSLRQLKPVSVEMYWHEIIVSTRSMFGHYVSHLATSILLKFCQNLLHITITCIKDLNVKLMHNTILKCSPKSVEFSACVTFS